MTPDEMRAQANTLLAQAEWHDRQADMKRAAADKLFAQATSDELSPPSTDERLRRIIEDI
jgi:hypothetical protein